MENTVARKYLTGVLSEKLNNDEFEAGEDSMFFRLDDHVGVKFFYSKMSRDRNYDRHVRFSDVAPKVGQKVEAVLEGTKFYGFMVEIVAAKELTGAEKYACREEVMGILMRTGRYGDVKDIHTGNIGYRKHDKTPVIVDFSRCPDPDGYTYHNQYGDICAHINGVWYDCKMNRKGDGFKIIKESKYQ